MKTTTEKKSAPAEEKAEGKQTEEKQDEEKQAEEKQDEKKKVISTPKSLNWVFQNSCIKLEIEEKFSQFKGLVTTEVEKKIPIEEQIKKLIDNDNNGDWNNLVNIESIFPIADRYLSFWNFYFKLKRLQDEDTSEEILLISCFEKIPQEPEKPHEKPHGEIRTNLLDLQSDIKEFLRYGVALQDVEFFAIASLIKRKYMKIELETVENELKSNKDRLIESILISLVEYLSCNHIDRKNDLYYISVVDFDNLLSQVDIKKYQFQAVRKMLVEGKYVKRGTKEISVTFRTKDKQIYRALAFDAERVEMFCKNNNILFPPATEKKQEESEESKEKESGEQAEK